MLSGSCLTQNGRLWCLKGTKSMLHSGWWMLWQHAMHNVIHVVTSYDAKVYSTPTKYIIWMWFLWGGLHQSKDCINIIIKSYTRRISPRWLLAWLLGVWFQVYVVELWYQDNSYHWLRHHSNTLLFSYIFQNNNRIGSPSNFRPNIPNFRLFWLAKFRSSCGVICYFLTGLFFVWWGHIHNVYTHQLY